MCRLLESLLSGMPSCWRIMHVASFQSIKNELTVDICVLLQSHVKYCDSPKSIEWKELVERAKTLKIKPENGRISIQSDCH